MEEEINRAAQILQYVNEREAIKKLASERIRQGIEPREAKQGAYLAVKAGQLLNQQRRMTH